MILLKDEVRYTPYTYNSEKELEDMVIEHFEEIFGENAMFFDKQTMETEAGIRAKNDGVIISLDENKWYVLEVELATHPIYEHIITQITKFKNAHKHLETRKRIVNAIFYAIKRDPIKNAIFESKIKDIHKFLTDLIDSDPTIAIVIDSKTRELEEACDTLPFSTKVVEFQTYKRENVGLGVHIHSFEPLFKKEIAKPEKKPVEVSLKTMPRALTQALEVAKLMDKGYSFSNAAKNIASKYKVTESTVRDKCTRQLGLNTEQFIQLAQNKVNLISLLKERYPEHGTLIEQLFA
ncbi:MAG: hypothetical protein ACE5OV_00290 [Candidatus Bathyarchaeia archaeon]